MADRSPSEERAWQGERGAFPAAGSLQSSLGDETASLPASHPLHAHSPISPSWLPPPSASPSGPGSSAPTSEALVAESDARAAEILQKLEAGRARVFFQAAVVVALLVLAALPILPGPTWLRALTAGGCLASALTAGLFYFIARDPKRYSTRWALGSAIALPPLATIIIYYLGLYSASMTFLTVGIYFYGTSRSKRVAWGGYITIAVFYFLGTAAIAVDIIPDLAVFSVANVPHSSRFYRVVMQQVIFGLIFYLARTSRRAMQVALKSAKESDLAVRQKEAQLLEARGELDRALRPAEGRMSGQVIAEYRLGDLLGRGGMGEVYAAKHEHAGDEVAIKLLHPAMLEDPTNVERFLREAKATSSVPSEHVARVVEVGSTADNMPFIVMELLEGHDLAWHLRRTPQLPLEQVVQMVEHTARALSDVRDAGIVHRDLKPGNLFLTDTLPRRWKVLDFGLSKLIGAASLTKDQAVGTPGYMSPEQIHGKDVDHLADLYALTAIAYRTITGRPPFVGDEIAKVLMDVLARMPESPGTFVKVPVEVELVLAIGMAKKKANRFERVEELAQALRLAATGELDHETRAKGWALLKQHPWGSTLKIKL
ncbi:MAG: protein kinase [Polyangiaceae bacterium]|nr:protein kinase [Polyangiaceae bacterium]